MRPTGDEHSPKRTVDADGVVRIEHPASPVRRLALTAAGLVLLALVWLFIDVRREQASPEGGAERGHDVAPPPARATARASTPRPELGAPVEPAESAGQEPPEVYVNQIDPASVEKTGIHLFPRPGTKPIKGGILVPEGYELPPGFMRHHQTTDDGEPVRAILMFHPDHRPLDADGRPIPLPADRVVPPELAPPGMPIEMLEAPPVRRDFDETSTPR